MFLAEQKSKMPKKRRNSQSQRAGPGATTRGKKKQEKDAIRTIEGEGSKAGTKTLEKLARTGGEEKGKHKKKYSYNTRQGDRFGERLGKGKKLTTPF